MRYRVIQPFIAFGKTPEAGDVVELTAEQADALAGMDNIAPYEVKILPKPENKSVKKPSGSSQQVRPSKKKTAKRSKKTAKK